MRSDLQKLGLTDGQAVLVHSSFKSLGLKNNKPGDVINVLVQAIGDSGTLLVPTLTYSNVTKDNPVFESAKTPSCIGAIPNSMLQMPGIYRSLSPTHSVAAIGKLAGPLTAGQEKDHTPVGENSPFCRLPEVGGKILMLGCGPEPNTSMHGVEEQINPSYLLEPDGTDFICIDSKNNKHKVSIYCHNFKIKNQIVKQRYDRLLSILDKEDYRIGKVLQADCVLIDAKAMWKKAFKKLKADPYFFVDMPV